MQMNCTLTQTIPFSFRNMEVKVCIYRLKQRITSLRKYLWAKWWHLLLINHNQLLHALRIMNNIT